MRIHTNAAANFALRSSQVNTQNAERSIQRLSSGFRINRSADDAAGLAIANGLRSDVRALAQAQRNTQQGIAMLQILDGATQTVSGILDRLKELAAQGNSDNVSDDQRALLDAEFQDLVTEMTRIANTTTYGGQALASAATTFDFMVSVSGDYAGDDRISVTTAALTAAGLGVSGDVTSKANSATALAAIDAAIAALGEAIGDIGAAQSRMDFAAANVATTLQNTQAAESTIRDADMAYEMTQFTKNNILSQAAQSMLAQANQSSAGILQLLRG